jgi:hypothetical protein
MPQIRIQMDDYQYLTHSYLTLRRALGWIGISLPFILMAGNNIIFHEESLPGSISLFYYTGMRDVLVGGICAIALFMFFYRGYDVYDRWMTNMVGVFALCVAFFPTTESGSLDWSGKIHFFSAACFFILLSGISLFLFTRGRDHSQKKVIRNRIYIICGIVMLLCMISIAAYFWIFDIEYMGSAFIFWAETIALMAFGISWLTKGGSILPDIKPKPVDIPEGL